jgi:hypothetical protein
MLYILTKAMPPENCLELDSLPMIICVELMFPLVPDVLSEVFTLFKYWYILPSALFQTLTT